MNKIVETDHRALAIYFLKIVDDCRAQDINTHFEIGQNMLANLARDFDFTDKVAAARNGQAYCAAQQWINENPEPRPKQARTKIIHDASGNVIGTYIEPDEMIRVTLTAAGREAMLKEWPSVNPMEGYEEKPDIVKPINTTVAVKKRLNRTRTKPGATAKWYVEALCLLRNEPSLSDAEIARRVGISRSLLSKSKKWKSARATHFNGSRNTISGGKKREYSNQFNDQFNDEQDS